MEVRWSSELKQSPKLVGRLVITPQLQQAIRLLQLTRLELVDLISQEMKENPLLEEAEEEKELAEGEAPAGDEEQAEAAPEPEVTPEVKGTGEGSDEFDWENYLENSNLTPFEKSSRVSQDGKERPSFENFLTKRTTLTDHLQWQLRLSRFTDEEREAGTWIIGNLDEEGYLRISLEDICSETNLPMEVVERVLRKIQQFDPLGVAARR